MDAPPAPTATRGGGPRAVCLRYCAATAAVFLLLLALVAGRWGPLTDADRRIVVAFHSFGVLHPGWTRVNRVLSDAVWDPATMRALLAVCLLWLVWRRAGRQALWLGVCGILGWALQHAVKAAVGRPRPHWPDPLATASYAAFPSGHAMTAAIGCGALLWLFLLRCPRAGTPWRAAAWALAAVSVVGVGLTRIYLGVHWPSDVLGGWLLGAAVLTGTAALCEPWRTSAPRTPRGRRDA
ncbi:phosphatase PAP2 family protein [Streptomyces sp. MI02-7b]|uniref:phosphatase PAP2 family protein n=1 Tax=Streptomyces sp. MI02-7b TaxID=462941 RepID=UPI0029BDF15C|nr:phosphatase PAP2 family protein [Streptomyces sp. MI02-7b]MDX3071545.1 phosphatase PAP2 family protein [Streptomyces sp. MI02-7b]